MNQVINRLGPLLQRVFKTNILTTVGGLVCLAAVFMLFKHIIDKETALEVMGSGTALVGFGAKDGVRTDPTVAAESLTAPDVTSGPPTGAAVVLILLALGTLSACAVPPSTTAFLSAPVVQVSQAPMSQAPDTARPAPTAPYLAAPPAGLTKRERRKYLRAQRRALVEASRQVPAKVKLTGGSAYAPDGTAVALLKPAAPVGIGPQANVTDNSKLGQHANGAAAAGRDFQGPISGATTPPKLSIWARAWATIKAWVPVIAVVAVLAVLAWLRFGPVGSGLRLAATAARRAQNQL